MQTKELLLNNNFLKICSFILGYSFWALLSNSISTSIWFEIPTSFYNVNESYKISCPESIKVLLKGKKSIIYNINKSNLALHINGEKLKEGQQPLRVNHENLFIPNNIEILQTNPINNIILYEKKS